MNVQDMNDILRDLPDRCWAVETRDLQGLWKHQDLSSDQKGKVLNALLQRLKTEEIKEISRQEDLSADHKEKVVDALLRHLGPWKLADSGVLDELERDLIVRQRIMDLWDVVDHYLEGVFSLIAFIFFVLIGQTLGVYVHEAWGVISLIAIGSVLITGVLGRILAAPFSADRDRPPTKSSKKWTATVLFGQT